MAAQQGAQPAAVAPPVSAPEDVDLTAVAAADRLLIALDFDGVIAPLVDDPESSAPLPRSEAAVAALAALDNTVVGYISGRELAVLRRLSRAPETAVLIGSHGLEADLAACTGNAPAAGSHSAPLTDDEQAALTALDDALSEIAALDAPAGDGELRIEPKPLGRTAHTRGISRERADFYASQLTALADRMPRLRSITGHDMREFAVRMETKGDGIDRMRTAAGADAVVFIGDDVTDEDALARLADRVAGGLTGLGVKVGTAETCASVRIADPEAVSALLERLLEARRAVVSG